jgi:glycosyltransferase involved in cell wall biosynthesis
MVSSSSLSPRVAVAMAVYNDERYLALSLEGLARQTFRDFHVTVHDDGSTDGSLTVLERCAVGRVPLTVVRSGHRGRHLAKQAAWREAARSEYLLVLDSDIVLPPDALERMVALMEGDVAVATVSARVRAEEGRPLGRAQAFLDDVFFESNAGPSDEGRWIVGGCVLLRRSAIAELEIRSDIGEDNDLSEKLRGRWRLLAPRDLVATHLGVPTTFAGLLRRFDRDGVRVRALLRARPAARQLGNVARLVPLPLLVLGLGGLVLARQSAVYAALLLLAGYVGAFLIASRNVPAGSAARASATLLFTVGNVAFCIGYLREALCGGATVMQEPERRY